jgi:amino acid transporter
MANQASVNGGPRVKINSPLVEGVFGNIAGFAGDVANLAELQAKLASHDLKDSISRATIPTGIMIVGGILALGAIPVLLIGVGELLGPILGLSHGGAMIAVAVLAIVLAAIMCVLALPAIKRSFASFQRSREELVRNLAWIKTVLTYSGR